MEITFFFEVKLCFDFWDKVVIHKVIRNTSYLIRFYLSKDKLFKLWYINTNAIRIATAV